MNEDFRNGPSRSVARLSFTHPGGHGETPFSAYQKGVGSRATYSPPCRARWSLAFSALPAINKRLRPSSSNAQSRRLLGVPAGRSTRAVDSPSALATPVGLLAACATRLRAPHSVAGMTLNASGPGRACRGCHGVLCRLHYFSSTSSKQLMQHLKVMLHVDVRAASGGARLMQSVRLEFTDAPPPGMGLFTVNTPLHVALNKADRVRPPSVT